MTMVEKVARAIWEQRREFWPYSDPPLEEWGDGGDAKADWIYENDGGDGDRFGWIWDERSRRRASMDRNDLQE